ncbi:MAG TPA: rod shape-determining protein, partial [Haloplasmataceae bacterium]
MAVRKLGIGIDLGTTNLLVYIEGHGIIFNEPSVVAFDIQTGEVIAGGEDAFSMIGKTHNKIRVSRPLREGVISDMDAAKALLRYVFERVQNVRDFKNSKCLICCPSEVTQIEREAMRELAIQMGINDVFIEEEIKSGAIGAGLDIYTANAAMVIDIGGGTTDVGVLSLGDVVLSQTLRIAGNYIDQEIIKYVHKTHNLVIGQKTAEKAKIEIATLLDEEEKFTRVSGRDLVTGLP